MVSARRILVWGILCAALSSVAIIAQTGRSSGPIYVSPPAVPTVTPAVRDLPDWVADPGAFGMEMKRRENFGFVPTNRPTPPKVDSLIDLQRLEGTPRPSGFGTLIHNYDGQTSPVSPPDDNGDVGPNHYLQIMNQSVSTARVLDKATGANLKTFALQSLATSSPCTSGFCDPVVVYDRLADRWLITELPGTGDGVCVYVSTSPDPTGTYYYYHFEVETYMPDYPKYAAWPQNGGGGSYLVGLNAGSSGYHDLAAFDRAKMLAGQPATFQKFSVPDEPNLGFQLVLPTTLQGKTAPPNGEPALFMRPRDDEAQDGASTPTYDLMEMWALSVDWATPANSTLTQLSSLHIADYDCTLCGLSDWNCMPQPNTSQKIDPIREPLHHPLVYRNFGDHQAVVGCFVEDVDGTDHAAMRWFELRKDTGAWYLYQEGVVGGEANVHRSVASISVDGSENIAIGYTRTGPNAPDYPSIYYKGRLSTDPLGTMPQGEYAIVAATTSNTDNERWGDYSGIGVDPVDDCTFWYTTEYGGSGNTKVAAFKFDQCGCLSVPAAPSASANPPQDNRIDVSWDDSAAASVTQYLVSRSMTSGGPYTQIASVPDSSPGAGGGPGYTFHDDMVSGGTRYYYIVKSTDGVSCTSPASGEVNALATGICKFPPTFGGLSTVSDTHDATCTLSLAWGIGASSCSYPVVYSVYRSTSSGFVPGPDNLVVTDVPGMTYADSAGLSSGTPYYYIVRAKDAVNGLEDGNTVAKSATPAGPITYQTLSDTFEGAQSGGGFDLSGWTHSALTGSTNWAWSTAQHHDGTHSWFAQDAASKSDMELVSPVFGVGPNTSLTFYHTYKFQTLSGQCNDGGTLEYSLDGSTWTVVPDADFTAGGFNGTVGTFYQNPIGGKRAWCGGSLGSMTAVSVNLGGDAALLDRDIRVRWHEGNDLTLGSTGWYLDSVAITNAKVIGTCAAGTAGPPRVPYSVTPTTIVTTDHGASATVAFDKTNCPSTNYHLLYGKGENLPTWIVDGGVCAIGATGSYGWSGIPNPSAYTSRTLWFLVVGDDGAGTEGSWGLTSAGAERSGTDASGVCGMTVKRLSGGCTTP